MKEQIELTEKLRKAREYEAEYSKKIAEAQRPIFHLSTPIGWMNDPNGFSVFKNEYHLFFQYHPYDTHWGPMHWAHYTTDDFVTWKFKPCALAPDMNYDKNGCFSGTAVESDGKHILMYTGVHEDQMPDGSKELRQTQCIAIGDGLNYEKYPANPVITADVLPKGSSLVDFRDPKIWKDDKGFWSIVGSKDKDAGGQLALFYSQNALDWTYIKMLDYNKNKYGEMWECPDFFPLDDQQVLIVSPQFMQADGKEFHNGNNTIYFIGSYDQKEMVWKRTKPHILDYGLDFYAAQTVEAMDGRRIMIAWMQSWDNYMTPDSFAWSGMMTVPRELNVRNGRIIQTPVRELKNYRKDKVSYQDYIINASEGRTEISGVSGRSVDLNITVKDCKDTKFSIAVAADERHETVVNVDLENDEICVNRNLSGMKKDFISTRMMDIEHSENEIHLRILVDYYSLELFVNHGERAMTTLIYTPINADKIFFTAKNSITLDIENYNIDKKV